MMRLVSLSPGLATGSRILHMIAPGSMERLNVSVQNQIGLSREIIDAAGQVTAAIVVSPIGILVVSPYETKTKELKDIALERLDRRPPCRAWGRHEWMV